MDRPVRKLVAPPLVWFLHFSVSYGSLSLLCRTNVPEFHVYLVAVATIIAILLLLVLVWDRPRETSSFFDYGSIALTLLSLVAVAWTTLSALVLPAC